MIMLKTTTMITVSRRPFKCTPTRTSVSEADDDNYDGGGGGSAADNDGDSGG